jgi:hypothetical protein
LRLFEPHFRCHARVRLRKSAATACSRDGALATPATIPCQGGGQIKTLLELHSSLEKPDLAMNFELQQQATANLTKAYPMRALASIAVFGVTMTCGILSAYGDPVLKSSNHFKTATMNNDLRSRAAIYQTLKPLSSSASDAKTGTPNERQSGRFAKTVIANGAKPLVGQPAVQSSARFAVRKPDSFASARFKSQFALAQGSVAREFRPGGRSLLIKDVRDSGTKNKQGVPMNKFPRN